jgi:adenylate cyclase
MDVVAPENMQPERLRRQIFSTFVALAEQRLKTGPLVLAVEDLQWADAASLELLGHLVDRLPDRKLLVVFTYRPGTPLPALAAIRAPHTGIPVTQLSAQDIERLLAALFGAAASEWPAELRALVVNRASGNPLYLEEILRSMIASKRLTPTQGGWAWAATSTEMEIPQTLQGIILSRLDRAAATVRRLVQEAAVLGPIFDAPLLQCIASTPSALDATLEASVQAQLLEEISQPHERVRRFRFQHTLLHEVAYQTLLLSRRTELHGTVAQALERTLPAGPRRLEDVMALAHHFSLSPDRRKAADYLVEAGDWAARIYANTDAVRYYERALEALRDCEAGTDEILGVRERLGDLFGLMGRRDAAMTLYEVVREGWKALDSRADLARSLRKIGGLHWAAGERQQALKCFHTGLDLLASEPNAIERAHLYQELGRCAFRSGDHRAAAEFAERALAQAEQLIELHPQERREAATAASHAHNTLGIALARLQRVGEAVDRIERSVAVAEANDLLQAAGRGYANLGVLYAAMDAKRGVEACQRGLEIAKKIGDFELQSRLYANLAVAYCALTDRCEEQGMDAARASIRLDRELDQRDHLAVPLIVLGQIYQCHGEPHRARECYNEALALAEQASEPQLLFPCYDGLATLHLELGEEKAAEEFLTRAEAVCQRHGIEPDHLTVLPFLT